MTAPRSPGTRRWHIAALAVVSAGAGAFATLGFPPVGLGLLAPLGAAVGLGAMRTARSAPGGALVGLAWGLGFAGGLFRWAWQLDPIAYAALALTQGTFWALTGAVVGRGSTLRAGPFVLVSAGAWTLVEGLRGRLPLGGFEWGQLGLAAADLPVRHAASVVGTLGLTGVLVALAASLAVAMGERGTWREVRTWRPFVISTVLLVGLALVGAAPWTQSIGTLEVAIAQAEDPCPGDFAVDCPGVRERTQDSLIEAMEGLSGPPDLLLWGEGTVRGEDPATAGAQLVERLGTLPSPLLAGVVNPAPGGRFANRNVLYDPAGEPLDWYTKRQPVPFGEYVPARAWLGGIGDVGRYVPRDMMRGDATPPMRLADAGVTLGNVVSWEVTFARLVRDAAQDSMAVVTLTTQATYQTAPVSDQLLGAAQLRAVETGRAQVVAATTGRSSLIRPDGTQAATSVLFGADLLEGEIVLREGQTPYMRWGDTLAIALALVALVGGWTRSRRNAQDALAR